MALMFPAGHTGLLTAAREPILDRILREFPEDWDQTDYPEIRPEVSLPWAADSGIMVLQQPGQRAWAPEDRVTITNSVLGRPIRGGRAPVWLNRCILTHTVGGLDMHLDQCHIGSVTDMQMTDMEYRPTTDGFQACRPGGMLLNAGTEPAATTVRDTDVINTHGRNGNAHMDGVQIWDTGQVLLEQVKIEGWAQAAVLIKSDRGPIDNVTIHGCSLNGAKYFQIRCIDGGHGRPTNITITDNVLHLAKGRSPMNAGNDYCSVASQAAYVRNEEDRRDPTWIVFANNCTPDGVEIVPPGGWWDPATSTSSQRFSR